MIEQPDRRGLLWSFSTLGCANLTLPEIVQVARTNHFTGIELRGFSGRMDMPECAAEQGWTPTKVRELCASNGVRLVVAGSSVKLANATDADCASLYAFCDWADSLGIPYVRAFGGGNWGTPLTDADYEHAAQTVKRWRQEKKLRGWKTEILLETHDAFSASAPCKELNKRLGEPISFIWDSHHTWRLGGEAPRETWNQLAPWIRHVHVKDSLDKPSARHPFTYVLPGQGQMPMGEVVAVLRENRFAGFVSLEWEKHWHPYLPPIQDAIVALRSQPWFNMPAAKTAVQTAALTTSGLVSALTPAITAETEGSFEWWQRAAESLLQPLAALMQPGKADLPLLGQVSNHGAQADRLESFARPCLLAAHWFASKPDSGASLPPDKLAEWFQRGLVIGTDPRHPEYWGTTANHHQHTVEMAALTLALQIARRQLWEPLSKQEKARVARWFGSVRGAGLHRNNHMFFCVLPLAFLEQEGFGRPADRATTRHLLDVLEGMALGGGWFIDGMNETVDYYAGYAWGYYGLWWAKLYGQTDPARARRWKKWAAEFIPDYAKFFAASGEHPPFGRSICYRFAASAPFGLAEYCGVSAIPPGQSRQICSSNLEFFLRHPVLQKQGALSLGWTDEFPEMTEAYSCAGSTYWAAKGFAPLLLPRNHEFWSAKSKLSPAATRGFQKAIPQAGLVVRSHDGAVEVLNNANGICVSNTKFGTWKWGKLSYRTGFGFEIAPADNKYPLDAALTAEFSDGAIHGRHQCLPIAVESSTCGSVYGLGDRYSQNHVSVESRLWWKAGWQLHWHHVVVHQPAILRLGTYSLPLPDAAPTQLSVSDTFAFAADEKLGVAIQPLLGFEDVKVNESDPQKRTHLMTFHSLVLTAETKRIEGEHELVALVWAGENSAERVPWKPVSSEFGRLVLRHPFLGEWKIKSAGLPEIGLAG